MGEKPYSVYMHQNRINKKIYIGVTKQNPERRFQNGYGYRFSKEFWSDIEKYGWDNFDHKILENELSKEEVSERERKSSDGYVWRYERSEDLSELQ